MKLIQIEFKPSIILSSLIVLLSLGAITILIAVSLAWQIKFALIALILISAANAVLQHGLLWMPNSIVGLRINMNNTLYLRYKAGQEFEVQVNKSTVVTPYLVVINCCKQNPKLSDQLCPQHIVLLNDKVESEHLRRLRVWLRWAVH